MTSHDARELPTARQSEFSTAEIGALAHLYRGEVYRSTVWRTRLDSSTDRLATRAGEPDRHGIGRSCPLLAFSGPNCPPMTQSGSPASNFSGRHKNSTDVVRCRPGSRIQS